MTSHLADLVPGAVHIWHIDLGVGSERVEIFRSILSADDLQRADRFHFERDRCRFVAAHAAMKTILSEYLGKPPQEIVLVYSDKGKPELGAGLTRSGLRFNLSHSRHRALLALTTHSRIGVDIEFINPEYSCDDIARRFFSPAEVHNLQALSPKQRSRAFFYCWTRKEAYIKALGEGLSQPLDSFDVAFMPGEPARLLRVEAQEDLLRWSVYDLPVPSGYAAAVVVEGREHGIFQQQWEWNRFC